MERFTLSVPERLLVELFDRYFLKQFPRNDPSSLRRVMFEGTEHSIAMKEEALEQFVFYDPSPSSATARNGLPVGDLNNINVSRSSVFSRRTLFTTSVDKPEPCLNVRWASRRHKRCSLIQ